MIRRLLLAVVPILLAVVARGQILQTSTIIVDTTADIDARDGILSLREAMLLATGALATASLTEAEQDNVSGSPGPLSSDRIVFDSAVFPAAFSATIELGGGLPPLGTGRDAIDATGRGARVDCAEDRYTTVLLNSDLNAVRGLEFARCEVAVAINGASNVVGGNGPGEGNVVVDATGAFPLIDVLPDARDTVIVGNFLGTDRESSPGRGANVVAVAVRDGATGTRIEGNVIGGNFYGISLVGAGSVVRGNHIGTDAAGEVALPNRFGVLIFGDDNQIGGPDPADRNLVSGNAEAGLRVLGTRNRVQGNFVGTDASGQAALGNGIGIDVAGSDNLIGGADVGEGNLISGNRLSGVALDVSSQVVGNLIGTAVDGAQPLGNEGPGVEVRSRNATLIVGNQIAFNAVGVTLLRGEGHRIAGNAIHSNTRLGIDLGTATAPIGVEDGVTLNDAGDIDAGPNGLQNFPVLTTATLALDDDTASCEPGVPTLTVAGTYQGAPATVVAIDLYASVACDPSGHGEGEVPLGPAKPFVVGVDGTVNLALAVRLPAASGRFITATATGPDGSTSEFSACIEAVGVRTPAAACDDGNPCTEDLCDPFAGCLATPRDGTGVPGCDDGNACNGDETCVAGSCSGGILPDCDDGDLCTVDLCDASLGCATTPRLGFESVTCRLDTMNALLAGAPELPAKVARKLGRRVRVLRKRVDGAARAKRPRRARRRLATAGRKLGRLIGLIARLRSGGRADATLLDALGAAAADTTGRLAAIR